MGQVQHVTIPSDVNHPWKGSDLPQDDRSVYIANGSGSGVWTPQGVGQIYHTGPTTVTTPTSYTRFAPATDFVASGLSHFVTEGDDEVTWTDGQSAYLSITWSITLSHTDASAREVLVSLGNATVVTGFERTVQSATLALNVDTTLSGRYLVKAASTATYSIYVKVAAGNITVANARMTAEAVF